MTKSWLQTSTPSIIVKPTSSLLRSFHYLLTLLTLVTWSNAGVITLTPQASAGDADGVEGAPWVADGVDDLQLAFDASDLPERAMIVSLTLRVQGQTVPPSYLSEIQMVLGLPSEEAFLWDFGETLGYPEAPGPFDTEQLEVPDIFGQQAFGTYLLIIGDDLNDDGFDVQIDQVDLELTYEFVPVLFPVQVGAFQAVSFAVSTAATAIQSGQATTLTSFEPTQSADLQIWTGGTQLLSNPPGLPPLPQAGLRYVTYGVPEQDTRIFFRVGLSPR